MERSYFSATTPPIFALRLRCILPPHLPKGLFRFSPPERKNTVNGGRVPKCPAFFVPSILPLTASSPARPPSQVWMRCGQLHYTGFEGSEMRRNLPSKERERKENGERGGGDFPSEVGLLLPTTTHTWRRVLIRERRRVVGNGPRVTIDFFARLLPSPKTASPPPHAE